MVIRNVRSYQNGAGGRQAANRSNSGIPSAEAAQTNKGEPVKPNNIGSGGTNIIAPTQRPKIEERPYTLGDAVAQAIAESPEWQALIAAGKVNEAQARHIILRQIG